MAAAMAKWMFTYNIPMVMNNFFYLMFFLTMVFGVLVGVFAARAMKKVEAYMPADQEYLDKYRERLAKKGKEVEEIVIVEEA